MRRTKALAKFSIGTLCALLACLTWACAARAGSYPDRRLTMYVGYPPGGTADRTARVLSDLMEHALGQSVVVENRGGASQMIAARALQQAPADGYSLLVVAEVDFTSRVITEKNLGFDLNDFTSVCGTATTPYLVGVVRADARWKTMGDVVKELKAKPGSLSWGTIGAATGQYWTMEMLQHEAGVQVQQIPYLGGGPAITALLGGQIDFMGGTYALWRPLIASGKVRVLAIQGDSPIAALPGVPTFAQMHWSPDLRLGWMRMLVRRGTPAPVLDKLVHACEALKSDAHAQEILRNGGADPVYLGPRQAARQAGEDARVIVRLARQSSLRPQ